MGSKPWVMGYIGTRVLHTLTEEDMGLLDVIHIAFGKLDGNRAVWDGEKYGEYIEKGRQVNPKLKWILSIGGLGERGFSALASTGTGREAFALSIQQLVMRYDLDGIDIDWEYPSYSYYGIPCHKDDKEHFTLLLEAARKALNEVPGRHRMLSIAAAAGDYYIEGTEMGKVHTYLDYINLMTYDMRGQYQAITGHHANLYTPTHDFLKYSGERAVEIFCAAGVPKEKLVIGAAYYSRKWSNVPQENNGYLQMTDGPGVYGPTYSQIIKDYIGKNDYVRYWDDEAKAPYLYNGNTFISYDDEESIRYKGEFAVKEGLCGVVYWEHSCDDTHTLLPALYKSLRI